MPPKHALVLQHELGSDEELANFIAKDGLSVVDVYAKWCGPCKAVVSLFKRVKNELGDDLLRFATICCDSVEKLKDYRGRCEPTFLFYASGGVLVAAVHGPNGPLLEKTIHQQLTREHKVLDGNADRVEVKDVYLLELQEKAAAAAAAAEAERNRIIPVRRQAALLLIKPDIVSDEEKTTQILEKISEAGFEILKKATKNVGREEAAELLKDFKDVESFEEMLELTTSGPCLAVVLGKGDGDDSSIVADLSQLVGPADPEKAQEEVPESLCAEFGTDAVHNAVFVTSSAETAEGDIALVFPRYKVPWVPHTAPPMQLGVILISPAFLEQHKDALLQQIDETDLVVKQTKQIELTREIVDALYADHAQSESFEDVCTQMTSGPSLAMLVEHDTLPVTVGELLGPSAPGEDEQLPAGCLRSVFPVESVPTLCLYGSASLTQAENDVRLLFPMQQTLALIKPSAMEQKDEIITRIQQASFHIALQEEKQLEKAVTEEFYAEHREKDFFGELTEFMSSGPLVALVLSARDGIITWRNFIGPTDPEQAKADAPDSLRAIYGTAVMHNAIHGSATSEDAQREISLLFGDAEFHEQGQLVEKEHSKDEEEGGDEEGGAAKESDGVDGDKADGADSDKANSVNVEGEQANAASEESTAGETAGDDTSGKSEDNVENAAPAEDGGASAPASGGKEDGEAAAPTSNKKNDEEASAAAADNTDGGKASAAAAENTDGGEASAAAAENKDSEDTPANGDQEKPPE